MLDLLSVQLISKHALHQNVESWKASAALGGKEHFENSF